MKNEHLIKQFMEENGIEFNKPFWVKSSNNEVKYKIIEKEAEQNKEKILKLLRRNEPLIDLKEV